MTTLSAVIMAHRKRAGFVDELLAKLDRPVNVVWDAKDNRWDTGRRAMLAYPPAATHHLVLQDDAIIPHDLLAGVEKAIAALPDPLRTPMCLYAGRTKPYGEMIGRAVAAAPASTSWLTMPQIHWGVGIVMPACLIKPMVAWCDRLTDVDNYDKRISRWCQDRKLTVRYPWPSLVDHRISPSLVEGRSSKGRHAHRFLGADASALECDFSGGVLAIGAATKTAPKQRPSMASAQLSSWERQLQREQVRLTQCHKRIKDLTAKIAHARKTSPASR